jgi:hypothetical protein
VESVIIPDEYWVKTSDEFSMRIDTGWFAK